MKNIKNPLRIAGLAILLGLLNSMLATAALTNRAAVSETTGSFAEINNSVKLFTQEDGNILSFSSKCIITLIPSCFIILFCPITHLDIIFLTNMKFKIDCKYELILFLSMSI